MIALQNLSKTYGQGAGAVTALHGVDFTIRENEFFTLLGPSGCGKTTLLRLIAGFEAPSGGALVLDGKDIAQMPPNKRPVNTVFQNYALFPHMTVAQNIAFGLETQGRPKAEVRDTVNRMLALVQMDHLRDRRTTALSGGQQQRVALARALAPAPRILLLDEPLSALDMKLRKEMQIELKRLQEETGITFIFVTHDQEEALTMSDRIAVMSNGRVHQIASPRDLYDSPTDRFVADFIGDSNFLPARIQSSTESAHQVKIGGADVFDIAITAHGPRTGDVAALVRPEDICLDLSSTAGDGYMRLKGRVGPIVFLGTDTHVHVTLDDGYDVVARIQNANPVLRGLASGARTTVSVPESAVRLVSA